MSSMIRRIEKRILKKRDEWVDRPQPVIFTDDGGYRTLRPTKGWIKVSPRRIRFGFS